MTISHDAVVALGKLTGLAGPLPIASVLTLVHEGTPLPKARARWSGKDKRFFTPNRTRQGQRDLTYAFRVALDRRPPMTGTVAILVLFYVPTRHRKDGDNLMKLVMDAGTKARVWLDDSQVTIQASLMELDAKRPRTVVVLGSCMSTLTKGPGGRKD